MSRLRLLFLVLLTFPLGCSSPDETDSTEAENAHGVILPESSELTYSRKPANPAYFSFAGELALEGIVLAYWDTQYLETEPTTLAEADPLKTLQLRFYPAPEDRSELPSFVRPHGEVTQVERVFLYRTLEQEESFDHITSGYHPEEAHEIKGVLSVFEKIPEGFLKHREGYVHQPVSIVLEGMVSFIEGDHRFIYAHAQTMEPLPHSEDRLQQIPDTKPGTYLGSPWVETFYVETDVVLREHPSHESAQVGLVKEGSAGIEKIRTTAEGWVQVRAKTPEQQEPVTGYVEASELMIIN